MFVMNWEEAIVKVMAEERGPMHYVEITQKIISRGYYEPRGVTPENSVGMYLRRNPNLFERVSKGVYKLIE